MEHRIKASGLLALGVAASAASLAFLPTPFAGFFLTWAFVLATLAGRLQRSRSLLLAIAVASLVVGATELVLGLVPTRSRTVHIVDGDPNRSGGQRDDVLGYAPRKSSTIDVESYFDDELIFSSRYTIDERGLRSSNPADRPRNGPCLLFFAGSDVFGRGLDDVDTLPWQVGDLAGMHTLNLAFTGWGPHQMLAAWDNGLVEQIAHCEVRDAFYLADDGHVPRVAGKRFWYRHGPRYELQDDGSVMLEGHFDDDELAAWILTWRLRSRIQQKWLSKPAATEADFDLFVAIVAKARAHVQRFSQAGDLHVLIWPNDWFEEMEERFGALGIPHHRIGDALPGYTEDKRPYRIHEKDSHPNRLANELLARYIVREILGMPVDEAQADAADTETPH
jgi:hypothetical protein